MRSLILLVSIIGCTKVVTPVAVPEVVQAEEVLTYTKDALPIFQARCSKCHHARTPGRNWLNYEDAFRKRIMIKFRIKTKAMPPRGNPITDEEREILMKWVDQGALK